MFDRVAGDWQLMYQGAVLRSSKHAIGLQLKSRCCSAAQLDAHSFVLQLMLPQSAILHGSHQPTRIPAAHSLAWATRQKFMFQIRRITRDASRRLLCVARCNETGHKCCTRQTFSTEHRPQLFFQDTTNNPWDDTFDGGALPQFTVPSPFLWSYPPPPPTAYPSPSSPAP